MFPGKHRYAACFRARGTWAGWAPHSLHACVFPPRPPLPAHPADPKAEPSFCNPTHRCSQLHGDGRRRTTITTAAALSISQPPSWARPRQLRPLSLAHRVGAAATTHAACFCTRGIWAGRAPQTSLQTKLLFVGGKMSKQVMRNLVSSHQGRAGQAQYGAGAGSTRRGALQPYQHGQCAMAFQPSPAQP